jgi:hypothetical protein
MEFELTGPVRILAGLLRLAAVSRTELAADMPPSADALIASKPELAALQQQVIERKTILELYGDLGDDRLSWRYDALTPPPAQGGSSYRFGTDHALDRLLAAILARHRFTAPFQSGGHSSTRAVPARQ